MKTSLLSRARGALLAVSAAFALVTTALVNLAGPAAPVLGAVALGAAAGDAAAAVNFSTTLRNNRCTQIVNAAGATGGKLKAYANSPGTRPSGVSSASGNTLLASVSWPSGTIGTCSGGVLTFNTSVSQTSSGFTAGTPNFFDITDSSDVVVARIDVCGSSPCWTFTGSIVTGQNITLTSLTFTEGNT